MQFIEISAKSLAEATKAAADKLGVAPEKLNVSVLEETKGLFGKSVVRIKAEVSEAAPTPAAPVAPVAVAPVVTEPVASEAEAPVQKKGQPKRREKKPAATVEESAPAKEDAKEAVAPTSAAPAKEDAKEAVAPTSETVEEEPVNTVVATQEDAEQLAELVRELVASAGLNVAVKPTTINGRYVNIQLDGKDVAFLVGKHGEVINSLQYLINIIAGRKFNNGVRVTLDGNDYRRRREDALTQLATNIAQQVKERGEEAVLDALPAFERRIVHKALSEYAGIATYSEGEEPNRRVVIAPAD